MKNRKTRIRLLTPVTLLLILILLALRLFVLRCSLWLCGLFVGVVVAYMILSDLWVGMKDQ